MYIGKSKYFVNILQQLHYHGCVIMYMHKPEGTCYNCVATILFVNPNRNRHT